jgi:hypothetical protein
LTTETTIVAKNPFDEPGKPGNVKATDWDKDHVDLKWTPPTEGAWESDIPASFKVSNEKYRKYVLVYVKMEEVQCRVILLRRRISLVDGRRRWRFQEIRPLPLSQT